MMTLVSACSPSWALPRPTRRPSSFSTRTWRRRRCAANSRPLNRPSSARTRITRVTGCNKTLHVVTVGSYESGIITNCLATSFQVFSPGRVGFGGHSNGSFPDLTAARHILWRAGNDVTTLPLLPKTKASLAGFFSFLFPFLGPVSLPHLSHFIRRQSTDYHAKCTDMRPVQRAR